jgi:uncharacterized protein (TIGR03435 family)
MVPRVWFCWVLGFWFASGAGAQPPRFTSATIRPSAAPSSERSVSRVDADGGYPATNVTLMQLLEGSLRRSGFDRREITGGPEWIRTDRVDVRAAYDGGLVLDADAMPRQTLRMRQQLLVERFAIRRHVDLQSRPVYALVSVSDARPGLTVSKVDCAAQMRVMLRGERIDAGAVRAERSPVGYHTISVRARCSAAGSQTRDPY